MIMKKHSWQTALTEAITDPKELLRLVKLDPELLLPAALKADQDFALKVPRKFIDKIAAGNIDDPLLKQILPIGDELMNSPLFSADPLAEKKANLMPGLLHKYKSRVLLILTGNCSINCRYCFRRHFSYDENRPKQQDWQKVFAYIHQHPEVNEIIFSGGDPLVMPDRALASLALQANNIPHLQTLRIHTRLPVMLPERITSEFLAWFTQSRLKPVMVLHINHPNEIDDELQQATQKMRQAGVTLLNQSVLLKGVNDDAMILKTLSEKLFHELDVLPYYLHVLDKVKGAEHFDVSDEEAKKIIRILSAELPGYLVPKLAREEAGKLSKTVLI